MNTFGVVLLHWTLVGFATSTGTTVERYDWRPLATLTTSVNCHKMAAHLQIKTYRCIGQHSGEMQ